MTDPYREAYRGKFLINKSHLLIILACLLLIGLILFFSHGISWGAENWKITAYCACKKCCGKTDAITASGKKAQYGYVACNWLPFGTKVSIEGLGQFLVMDRGAKSLFGSKTNHIKHLDVYLPTHRQALNFGVRYTNVQVLK